MSAPERVSLGGIALVDARRGVPVELGTIADRTLAILIRHRY